MKFACDICTYRNEWWCRVKNSIFVLLTVLPVIFFMVVSANAEQLMLCMENCTMDFWFVLARLDFLYTHTSHLFFFSTLLPPLLVNMLGIWFIFFFLPLHFVNCSTWGMNNTKNQRFSEKWYCSIKSDQLLCYVWFRFKYTIQVHFLNRKPNMKHMHVCTYSKAALTIK